MSSENNEESRYELDLNLLTISSLADRLFCILRGLDQSERSNHLEPIHPP